MNDDTTRHFQDMKPDSPPSGESPLETTLETPDKMLGGLAASIRDVEDKLLGRENHGEADPLIGTTVGPYRVNAFLGIGGMGRVYRATDTRLKRTVALKFLKMNDPGPIARLLQEAQALARLDHGNVCRVFDVGEIEGKPFIAMQYIDGVSLSQQAGELYQEQKLRLIKAAAEGLGEAHRLGLVHRDIKPGNIMLEKAGVGNWKPILMDFGLARQVGEKGVSVTGEIMGTPMYMAPEQAAGKVHDIGPRTDVYSLGATLYELLAGRPLWETESPVNTLACILLQDPLPLRAVDRRIPEDLETLVMKCLERDPFRRYVDASELAADLGRYLEGEPVLARKASVGYRLWKKVRKNKALSLVLLLSLVMVAALSVLWARSAYLMARKVELAALFDREIRYVESYVAWVRGRPLHDTRNEMNFIRAGLDRIRYRMEREGPVARGPGNSAIGRGLLALGEYAPARDNLRKAVEEFDYRTPEVCYYLGLSLTRLYEAEIFRIQLMDPSNRPAARARALTELRDPALAYLKEGRAVVSESPEYVEALLGYLDDRFPEAEAKAREGLARCPWQSDIEALLVKILFNRAESSGDRGDAKSEAAFLSQAGHLVDDLVRRYPSDMTSRRLRTYLLYLRLRRSLAGEDVKGAETLLARAKAERTAIRAIDPGAVEATKVVLLSEYNLAEFLIQRGIDPDTPLYDEGLHEARRMVETAPQNPTGYLYTGAFLQLRANALPPAEKQRAASLLAEAAAILRRGEQHAGDDAALFSTQLGNTLYGQGSILRRQGGDPTPLLDEAIGAYRRTIRFSGRDALHYQNLATALLEKGIWFTKAGKNGIPLVVEAREAFRKALALDAGLDFSPVGIAIALEVETIGALSQGKDASFCLKELRDLAMAPTLKESLRKTILPVYFEALQNRGYAAFRDGGDARDVLALYGETLRQWETTAPPTERENTHRLMYHLLEAEVELAGSRSPEAALKAAEGILKALSDPANPRVLLLERIRFHRLRGEEAMRAGGGDPEREFRKVDTLLKTLFNIQNREAVAAMAAEAGALKLDRALLAKSPEARRDLAIRALDCFRQAQAKNALIALEYSARIRRARALASQP
ncbi:MAG: serine/threonine protein kinase [Acidobacteria bacterium]|nr:serine/threonine protein kinase [Acidobacteriota bacterium]